MNAVACLGLALGALRGPLQEAPGGSAPPELPLELLEDLTTRGVAFVELASARDAYLAREPFTLTLRLGLEREFLRARAVQPFQRALDVPVQVHAPWLLEPAGAEALGGLEPERGPSLALGEQVVACVERAERTQAGQTYRVFELSRRFAAPRPGPLELGAPLLHLCYATRFEDDFAGGRRAADRHDALVRGAPLRLAILAPPEEERPARFSGAIGSFTLEAAAEPRALELGQELTLTLTIAGAGDLSQCEPPALDDLAGFHVRGRLVERADGRLSARYDLVPERADLSAIPAIEFVYFDPQPPAGYRTALSAPLAITVQPRPREAIDVLPPPRPPDPLLPPGATESALIVAGVLVAALVWLGRRARRP